MDLVDCGQVLKKNRHPEYTRMKLFLSITTGFYLTLVAHEVKINLTL